MPRVAKAVRARSCVATRKRQKRHRSALPPMSCFRPATPGFLATLAATILLAIVSFSVPLLKSIYFLKASVSEDGFSGSITFGTLGYCLELSNGTTCSKPSVGYELGSFVPYLSPLLADPAQTSMASLETTSLFRFPTLSSSGSPMPLSYISSPSYSPQPLRFLVSWPMFERCP